MRYQRTRKNQTDQLHNDRQHEGNFHLGATNPLLMTTGLPVVNDALDSPDKSSEQVSPTFLVPPVAHSFADIHIHRDSLIPSIQTKAESGKE
jgi:hypothetical protein